MCCDSWCFAIGSFVDDAGQTAAFGDQGFPADAVETLFELPSPPGAVSFGGWGLVSRQCRPLRRRRPPFAREGDVLLQNGGGATTGKAVECFRYSQATATTGGGPELPSATFSSYGDTETAGDVLALIEQLGELAIVVGNSLGAGAAALAPAQKPELVCGRVLLGPFGS